MKISDRLFGVAFLIIGTAVAAYGLSLPTMAGQAYGAGIFPTVIGCCLALAGGVLSAQGWMRRKQEALVTLEGWTRSSQRLINVALTVGCILAFAIGIRQLGFAVLAAATITILLGRFGQPLWRASLVGLVAATAFQLLFVSVMRVPLPPGILYGLIY
ncbi:MAG TPA: tripartite tricarboxylate transporter TctB family protein [Hyphomicrobiaceae bacterium]|jgi:putative tricarboxylic transport membrane protein|nr:tripartite tricarboxylate transporter TctB family protein [Hyphomicrobiaceae bacterium]